MGKVIKLFSIHMDFGALTRAHMMYARGYLGTDKVGWFKEDLYHTHALIFFDANQYTIEEIERVYAPYHQMSESKESEWVHSYQAMFGWELEMVFDLANPTISGVLEEVDSDKDCLVIQYGSTEWLPIEGKIGKGIIEVTADSTEIWREHDHIPNRRVLMKSLPDWQWGDIDQYFWYQTNGGKDEGYYMIDERGRITDVS